MQFNLCRVALRIVLLFPLNKLKCLSVLIPAPTAINTSPLLGIVGIFQVYFLWQQPEFLLQTAIIIKTGIDQTG